MKSIYILLCFALITINSLRAEIIYTDIEPDSIVAPLGTEYQVYYYLDLDNSNDEQSGDYDFTLTYNNCPIQYGGPYVDIFCAYYRQTEVLTDENRLALALDKGDLIDADQKNWLYLNGTSINVCSDWVGAIDKYLGLRVKKGSKWIYGWVRLDIPEDVSNFVVKDVAYQKTLNQGLRAGETVESSVFSIFDEDNQINIFPNPCKSYISLSGYQIGETVVLIDSQGNQIETLIIDNGLADNISITDLPNGVYFVKCRDKMKKFIITR